MMLFYLMRCMLVARKKTLTSNEGSLSYFWSIIYFEIKKERIPCGCLLLRLIGELLI